MASPVSSFKVHALGVLHTHSLETACVVMGVALTALAILQISGCLGGPDLVTMISVMGVVPVLCLTGYCLHSLYQSSLLAKLGLYDKEVTVDSGNCLFDSVRVQLAPEAKTVMQLREDVAQHIEANLEAFSGFLEEGTEIDAEIARIRTNKEWANDWVVSAMAAVVNRPIYVIRNGALATAGPYNADSTNPPLFLHYVNGSHYKACFPVKRMTAEDVAELLYPRPAEPAATAAVAG